MVGGAIQGRTPNPLSYIFINHLPGSSFTPHSLVVVVEWGGVVYLRNTNNPSPGNPENECKNPPPPTYRVKPLTPLRCSPRVVKKIKLTPILYSYKPTHHKVAITSGFTTCHLRVVL